MTRRLRLIVMLGISVLVAFAILRFSGGADMEMDEATGGVSFDQNFIDMMTPHHEGAVEMAKIAQERGEHAELKALADSIVLGQAAEIDQMKGWRQEWFGSSQTPPMNAMPVLGGMEGMGESMDLAAEVEMLRAAPEPFDLAFINAMIPHHQSALDAARLAQTQAERPEVKALANHIIVEQETEIARMQAWKSQWYP